MRRPYWYFLLAWCLAVLTGCAVFGGGEKHTVTFYYQSVEPSFASYDGVLGSETYVISGEMPTYQEFLNLYFGAQQDPSLISPFPKGLTCLGSSLDDGVITLLLSDEYDMLIGLDRSIVTACITKTLSQFESVAGVCLETEKDASRSTEPNVWTEKDFVCQDLGAVNTEPAVQLYFSDSNGRYLLGSERKSFFSDAELIPAYIIQQLIEGPTEDGQLAVMPEGTSLRGISVDDSGTCTVNLSSEFLLNKPATELLERMTVLAIVNSLTELESIKTVRFQVEGEPIGHYLYMDLSIPYQRDESAIGVVRSGMNETDATLYVRSWSDDSLAAIPVRIRRTTQMSEPEVLLQKLLEFRDINGTESPVPSGMNVLYAEVRDRICHVDFSRKFLECAGDEERERFAVRSIVATLTSLDGIDGVQISISGHHTGFQYFDLEETFRPSQTWFF